MDYQVLVQGAKFGIEGGNFTKNGKRFTGFNIVWYPDPQSAEQAVLVRGAEAKQVEGHALKVFLLEQKTIDSLVKTLKLKKNCLLNQAFPYLVAHVAEHISQTSHNNNGYRRQGRSRRNGRNKSPIYV